MRSLILCLVTVLALIGCGGTGTEGVVNLYTGTWTGPWSAGNDNGTATFHITGFNSVSGTIIDATANQTYNVSGSISNPNLSTTGIHLAEENNGNSVEFDGTIVEQNNYKSFSGTLTQVGNTGVTQTITLSFTTGG